MSTRLLLAAAALILSAASGSAQVLGTFPWQLQPYCHVVTITLTSAPMGFTLDGVDNQCGATNQASVVGVAAFNGGGNVTLNFSVVTAPAGRPVHVSAVVSPATGSGTWTDSVGNSGAFTFFGNVPGLPPRPLPASGLPAAIITTTELADNAVTGAKVANGSLTSADLVDVPRAAFAGGGQQVVLSAADSIVRSLSLTAPAPGRVIVNASAQGSAGSASTDDRGECWIEGTTRSAGRPAVRARSSRLARRDAPSRRPV